MSRICPKGFAQNTRLCPFLYLALQVSLVTQSCPTPCDPMDCMQHIRLPVHHQLLELNQTHICRVSNAIQPSHPLLSPSPPTVTSTSALSTTPKPLTVDHNKLWKILKEMGIPDHLTCLLRKLYTGQEATVRTGHGTMD